ncbi:MAG: SDR family oxidoreductase [Acidimicrobiales bacterium]
MIAAETQPQSTNPNRPVVVVTGASAGVGRATARAFAERGFDVALLARGADGLARAADEVQELGVRALPISVDMAVYEEVDAAASRVERELGPIDVWVNDAMTTVFAPATEIEPADFRRAVEVTFLGQVWGTKAALSRMKPRARGSVVNVGSALAFIGIPLQSAYCASKFACRGFFEATRAELIHEKSRVTMSMVHLPAVNTPQFEWCKTVFSRHPQPVAPIYQPEQCAKAIVEAALSGRREKVLGSWNKILVWASRATPGLGNQFAARGAWEEQLSDRPNQPGRPVNLYKPADVDKDYGAHGTFDDRANGFFSPSFLVTLPKALKNFALSFVAAWSDRLATTHLATRKKWSVGQGSQLEEYSHAGGSAGPSEANSNGAT